MRLLIHAAGIAGGGGMRHLLGFLPALHDALAGRGRAWVVVREPIRATLPPVGDLVEVVPVPDRLATSPGARLIVDNVWVPYLAQRHAVDVVVSLANFGPLRIHRPHVVFQTNARYYDPLVYQRASVRERVDLRLRQKAAKLTMQRASAIVTPSSAMSQLLRSVLPGRAADIVTIPHGVPLAEFSSTREAPRPPGPLALLCAAVTPSYKGLDILVPALAELEPGSFTLRAYGSERHWPEGVRQARSSLTEMGLAQAVSLADELPPSAMPAAYRAADALVHPSLCESFGFALIEALASGLPVVASDIPVNRELAGDAALYYDPLSSRDLGRALRRLIESEDLRTELVQRGTARLSARDWSWKRHAEDFLALCEGAC